MKSFELMDHPGQKEIDNFYKEELKKDAKAKRRNQKSNKSN